MKQVHRVKRDRLKGQTLPVDRWQGRTFVEATGQQFEVIWDGRAHGPKLLGDWPEGSPSHSRTIGHPVVPA